MTELDGIEELKGIVVLAASNRPDIIDPALLRPGRFDVQLELPVPDEKTRLEIFRIHTKDKPLANDVKLESLAKTTEGLVGSGIEGICRSASMLAIREFVNELGSRPEASEISAFKIAAEHFEQALETVRK